MRECQAIDIRQAGRPPQWRISIEVIMAIPATLQDALMARLDRLAPVKEVAQIGAVLGREFAYELLAAVSPLRDDALQEALDQLVSAGLLFRRGTPPEARYRFKQALVQNAAYASLLKSMRQQIHQQIAQVLAEGFPETRGTQPELLLMHSMNHHAEVEIYLRRALDIARSQHTKSLELRAAASLSRLWQQQGKCDAAKQLLAEVYDWFTEGFDTADLREAKALLER